MIIQYGYDGSTKSLRGSQAIIPHKGKSIDTIEIIINGESVLVNSADLNNDIGVFSFRVGVNGLSMVGDDLSKESK